MQIQFVTQDGIAIEVDSDVVNGSLWIQEQLSDEEEPVIHLLTINAKCMQQIIAFGRAEDQDKDNVAREIFYHEDGLTNWCNVIEAAYFLRHDELHKALGKVFANETMNKTVEEQEQLARRRFTKEERHFVKMNTRWTHNWKKPLHGGRIKADDLVLVLTGSQPRVAFQEVKKHMTGWNFPRFTLQDAADYGHVPIMRELLEQGERCRMIYAARGGCLEAVKLLREYGVKIDFDCVDDVARNGHMEVMRYFTKQGVHISSVHADAAAAGGHVEMIRFLRRHGVNCTSSGADVAAFNGHLKVIRYLRKKGIHCTHWGALWAKQNNQNKVVRNLKKHGIEHVDGVVYPGDRVYCHCGTFGCGGLHH